MQDQNSISPGSVRASYTPQRLPHFKDNPLIEALPPSLSDEVICEALTRTPEFSPEQREWTTEERITMLGSLGNFLVPLARHVELVRSLDSMIRNGYVGRAPRTKAHIERYQAIYSAKTHGGSSFEKLIESPGQISGLLMGLSGMGKTSAVKEWLSTMPQVIFHPDLNVYQVTYLHVEAPSDGSSIKGLAHGILAQVDRLVPGANYYKNFAGRGNPGADTLMRSVSRVLNIHHVGLLVIDEIQNLANSHKGKQTVMTELVSACNELGLPILFIGTQKAAKVFSLDFRQSRRASGRGLHEWGRLVPATSDDEVDEWDGFLRALWTFQWVRYPSPLDARFRELMYHYSQGVVDVAIKLFASAQARAMLDASERITSELLTDVYIKEMRLLHPMIDALRDDNQEALLQFEDIAPVGLDQMLAQARMRATAKVAQAHQLRSNDLTYEQRIATALLATGFGEREALQAAAEVAQEGKAKSLVDGVAAAIAKLGTPKKVPKAKAGSAAEPTDELNSYLTPEDYRSAIVAARKSGTTVFEQLAVLGMARPLEEVLDLR